MVWGGEGNATQATTILPLNSGGGAAGCYNGGKWTINKTGDNTYHVIVSGYKFSPNFTFPIRYYADSATTIRTTANIGYFSAGYINVLCSFPDTVDNLTNIYLTAEVKNLKAKSATNQQAQDLVPSNEKNTSAITLYPAGSISKNIILLEPFKGARLEPNWTERGDASRYQGQLFTVEQQLTIRSDTPMKAYDNLLKFDDKGFEYPTNIEDQYSSKVYSYATGETGNLKILYGAKPDKSGWKDHQEMIDYTQEDLIYFTDINELVDKGYTCVAILQEGRNCNLPRGIALYFNLKVKDDAKINATYDMVSDFREWEYDIDFSFENLKPNQNGTYDLNSNGFVKGYPKLSKRSNTPYYVKTEYDDYGHIIAGTHAGGILYGNTILVKGYSANIEKRITDKVNGVIKTTYDMDKSERTVNYSIIPSTTANKSTGKLTNLYITDTLPKDLTYNTNSATWNNQKLEPKINKNSNGTTTLEWTLNDVEIGKTLSPIYFSCTIGKAGTTADVLNNQQITNTASIRGDGDKRELNINKGNVAETSFSVIKLNAVSISKSTETPYINIGQNFNYILKFANNSQNKLENAKLYDVLPYNGDSRGSNFSGSYKINSIILDFSNAPKTFTDYVNNNYALQYTTDTGIQSSDFNVISSFNKWSNLTTKSVDNTKKTVTFTNIPNNIKGLLVNTSLEGFEYIDVTLNMVGTSLNGKTQQEGDLYVNDIYQYSKGQVEQVHSNNAVVQVYGSLQVTKIWQDKSNAYNTRPNNLNITIYQNGNEYKTITLTGTQNTWTQKVTSVPLYDERGNQHTYTIREDENNINLKNFYGKPVYNQSTLTVTNKGTFIPTESDEFAEYKIIVHKDIINEKGNPATSEDFDKVALDSNDTYNFAITLKQLNRTVTNTGTKLLESYNGYSGKVFNGIVTNKGDLIFNLGTEGYGKYEISENVNQYFDFIDIEKLNDELNTEGASFSKENGKYYITLSGVTGEYEQISVKVTNQIKPDRPYNETKDKDNLFKLY